MTCYGLDGPVIEYQWEAKFSHPFRPALWPTQPPIQWVPGLSTRGKATTAWRCPPTPSSAKVKERVELYLYSPFWAFTACSRVNSTIYLVAYIHTYIQGMDKKIKTDVKDTHIFINMEFGQQFASFLE
jgi:hypothetical protein